MKINLNQALVIAKQQKEIGCCSANGQAIVILYEEIERLKEILSKLGYSINKSQID